ncbi:MAG: CHASE domain-containing protein [Telluria sp.]
MPKNDFALPDAFPEGAARVRSSPVWLATGTLLFSLLATAALWHQSERSRMARVTAEFESEARYVSGQVARRMATYEQVLRGVKGRLNGSMDIGQAEFHDYVATLQLGEQYPGIQGVAAAEVVHPAQVADGSGGYRIWPAGARRTYTAVTRIEPLSPMNARALGFDMFSEPVRRAAMEKARDTGHAALSGKVTLVQELPAKAAQAGALLYLPVYRRGMPAATLEQRRAAIIGWVYAPFRIGDFMRALENERYRGLTVSLHDGVAGGCLYGCGPARARSVSPPLASKTAVEIAGRSWIVDVRGTDAFEDNSRIEAAQIIAAGGVAASLLLASLVWALGSGRQRALALAMRMTEELRASGKALEAARRLESIGMLTGGVAHDFNNVLQIISGNVQLLRMYESTPEKRARRLESIASAVERGAKLSAQLLAFARRQELHPQAVDLRRLLAGIDDLLQRAIGVEVALEVSSPADLWDVLADPAQLENVILNLAINARDAMNGRGRFEIALENIELDEARLAALSDIRPGEYVRIAARDNGAGMPAGVRARAFDPFFTTKPEGQGSGLGLSMAYGFVKQSGGHIEIGSEEGKGTTISIYLPRSAQAAAAESGAGASAEVAGGKGETILVVDDDLEVRDAAAEMLAELGYRVLRAADGESALKMLEGEGRVDLLFTDVVMPGPVTSTDLVREATLRRPGLAVLLTSGFARDLMDRVRDVVPGAQLLGKPYQREELALKVRQLLDAQGDSTGSEA